MYNKVIGLILADDLAINLGELSYSRGIGAMPFGGRYRLIDFALSNFVNTGMLTIGVSTFLKYRSLMDHLGTGAAWDLDRMNQGLHILPPNYGLEAHSGESYDLTGLWDFYRDFSHPYIIISTCHCVFNMTYEDFIETHINSGADMTVLYNEDGYRCGSPITFFDIDENNRITGVYYNPEKPKSNNTSVGTLIMHRELFVDLLSNMMSRGIQDASFLTFLRMFKTYDIRGYKFEGEALRINSIQSYFNETMRVLSDPVRSQIFYGEYPIYTKVKDEAPTYYNDSCVVDNSMISDGCVIQGTVQDSMLFRGVTVSGQSTVNNSILFQDTFVSEGCQLENVIVDKNSVIRPGTKLIGNPNYPIVIGKGVIV